MNLNDLSALAMDTLRDKQHLENLWESGDAPWRVW